MRLKVLLFLLVGTIASGQAPKVVQLHRSIKDYSTTRAVKPGSAHSMMVFPGDDVIPQFVNGGSWKTTLVFANLGSYTVNFDVYLVSDNGDDMNVAFVGMGAMNAITVTLPPANTLTLETDGAGNLQQGWAVMDRNADDTVGGLAIFRQSVAGRQDQEAVVPFTSMFNPRTLLLFDNVGTSTGVAMVHPFPWGPATVSVTIRDEDGNVLGTRSVPLPADGHTALDTAQTWPETAGKRGTLTFLTTDMGVAVLGLRFNGAAFTSLHSLENMDWLLFGSN